ncbi:hypothetical protein P389DRAFT_199067 [Cystobasidium minutum MCA 4210]|uniref:uncharacterized protein n=1 Tax=Cystobasidium minutum MCA 4210 TaxID=1397322 RepID=UPI0034CE48D0|eukprot:jgi/Rhomi1/199067/gm1.7281_g
MAQSPSISPITAKSSSSSSSSNPSSPTSPVFPFKGDAFKTREELSTLIKGNGKAIGYIFKCSVTSEHKVTYYCSNKYHSPRCMAGFKAAYVTELDRWIVTEATEHNEGCTRARQRVNGLKPQPVATPAPSKSTASVAPKKAPPKPKPAPVVAAPQGPVDKTRKTAASLRAATASSAVPTAVKPVSPPATATKATISKNDPSSSSSSVAATHRKQKSDPTTSASGSTSPLTSVILASRRGSLTYGTKRALREVDENEALELSEDEAPVTSSRNLRSGKKVHVQRHETAESGGRDRSSSSVSSQSTRSERSQVTTILDPVFHFPPPTLEACEMQKNLPCRRKRSASYIKSTATSGLLLGTYLDSQREGTSAQ